MKWHFVEWNDGFRTALFTWIKTKTFGVKSSWGKISSKVSYILQIESCNRNKIYTIQNCCSQENYTLKSLNRKMELIKRNNVGNELESVPYISAPTDLTALNDDCKQHIFNYLKWTDLISLADASKQLRTAVYWAYQRNYRNALINIGHRIMDRYSIFEFRIRKCKSKY